MSFRIEKIREVIKALAAEFLERESDRTAMITVTGANISNDFRNATVFFTVYPENSEKAALLFAKRKRSEFKKFVQDKIRMKRIPIFNFEIDMGEKNRQRLDELSNS